MRISTHGSRREGCERIASVGSGRVRSQYLTYYRSGGHGGIGALFAGVSVGTLIGSLLYTAIALRLSRYRVFLIAAGMLSGVFWVLAPFPALIVAMLAVALRGVATGLIAPLFGVVQQERVPADLRGRVFGTSQAMGTLAVPLGTLLAGVGISTIGLRDTLMSMGGVTLMVSIGCVSDPALRGMNAHQA